MTGVVTTKIPSINKWSLAQAKAPDVVLNLYNSNSGNKLFFHSYSYSSELASQIEKLARELELTNEDSSKAVICGWFYSTGRLLNYADPVKESQNLLNNFLSENDLVLEQEQVYADNPGLIENFPLWIMLLKDVIIAAESGLTGQRDIELKRLEDDYNQPTPWVNSEWEHYKFHQLLEAKFVTKPAKLNYEEALTKKIVLQKQQLEKLSKESKKLPGENPDQAPRNRRLQANAQNFLRVSFRNHIELTKMADNRAHIMISVNSILTGVLISYISYQNLPETQPKLLIPVIVFMITSLTSLIFAILCARPRIIRSLTKDSKEDTIKENIASFSNFTMLSQMQYEEAMGEVLTDNTLMIGNLKKELYQTGKILDIKFKYLGFSYNIFMFGFVACVLLFMGVFMLG